MEFDRIFPADHAYFPVARDGTLRLPDGILENLSAAAFARLSFTFTREHLDHLVAIAADDASSRNDRLVSSLLLRNALVSSKGTFPLCQDTGTAQVFGWKDQEVLTPVDDAGALSAGAERTYRTRNLRFSTTVPSSLFEETDPGNNMPAQVLIQGTRAESGAAPAFRFLFCAKGGGSSNKTVLVQATKALLTETAFTAFLEKQIGALGTAACPPYSISVVAGGISPEQNLLALKLATAGYFDRELPGWDYRALGVKPLREEGWERKILEIASRTGFGAQFGGTALAVSARVLRLPRHGASCPVSIGVSCSAHRNLHAYIDPTGVYLERTVADPLTVPSLAEAAAWSQNPGPGSVAIHLDAGIEGVRKELSGLKPGTALLLSGTLLVARDAAHARWRALLAAGKPLPEYVGRYAILYAGPAGTPPGEVTGSFGPTTAGRMDEYAEDLMSRGAALVTIAKGNRSAQWRTACARYGAFYLGTVGGAAALIAESNVTASEVIDYPELGMEAVRLVTVSNLPAFVLIDDRGEDFYANLVEGT